MTLIDACDSRPGTTYMVEHRLRHLKPNSQPLKSCGERPPKVMEPPRRHKVAPILRNQLVEHSFAFGMGSERGTCSGRKHPAASWPLFITSHLIKLSDSKIVERNGRRLAILCSIAGQPHFALRPGPIPASEDH